MNITGNSKVTFGSIKDTSNMVGREIKHVREGNLPGIEGVIIILLAFILFRKSIKLFKGFIGIVVVVGLLMYLTTLWG